MTYTKINKEDMIVFEEGIPGFEHLTEFVMLEDEAGVSYYLQSVQDQAISFAIINPFLLVSDYAPYINESYFSKLGGGHSEDYAMYVIITLKKTLQESSVNLQAPLLIHATKRKGVQVIVEDKHYTTQHKIAHLLQERGA